MTVGKPKKVFIRYQERGAYHWQWLRANKYSYRDYAHRTLGYFLEPGTIIDIGCGDGVMSYLLFQRGFDVTGVDPDPIAIQWGCREIVRRHALRHPWDVLRSVFGGGMVPYLSRRGLRLCQESIHDVPDSARFDYALCQEVIEHVPEPQRLIAKVLAITRRFAIFTTPNGLYHEPAPEDYQFWEPDSFLALLGRARAELLEADEMRICARLWC